MDMIDIEAEQRLENNQRLLKDARKRAGKEEEIAVGMAPPVKIVAGNKCDLKDARVVSARQGLEYARKRQCGFMETSAREMVNIEETFACTFCPSPSDYVSVLDSWVHFVRPQGGSRYAHPHSLHLCP
jgi:hypothetical protein